VIARIQSIRAVEVKLCESHKPLGDTSRLVGAIPKSAPHPVDPPLKSTPHVGVAI